ncbi:MAG: glycosyltransferase family 4 protein, partial [Ferruginibacter sp.]|nr:glycosyltransferase family 4 protein [Ferruginibacter sp.]
MVVSRSKLKDYKPVQQGKKTYLLTKSKKIIRLSLVQSEKYTDSFLKVESPAKGMKEQGKPDTIPDFYNKAKIFLFPTLSDPWGIVANEACASGVPVITCKNSGSADDLVIDGHNGYVLPLDPEIWADSILKLLTNTNLLQQFSDNALRP